MEPDREPYEKKPTIPPEEVDAAIANFSGSIATIQYMHTSRDGVTIRLCEHVEDGWEVMEGDLQRE